jgi:hypothetical protein
MPALVKVPGLPEVDEFHGGRPVPLVRLFYDNWMGVPKDVAIGAKGQGTSVGGVETEISR